MRFFKTKKDFRSAWGLHTLPKDTILSVSNYYNQVVIVSNGHEKTEFTWLFSKQWLFDCLMDGDIRFLTKKELNKIRPHLTKEQLKHDL